MADKRMLPADSTDNGTITSDEVVIETTEVLTGDDIDKGWAWVVLLASWFTYVLIGGSMASVGLFYMYMLESLDGSTTNVAWVGSLYSGLHCFIGPLGSYLCNRFSSRRCMIGGSILATVSLVASSQVTSLWLMFITFGVLSGSGLGLVLAPLFFSPGYYFVKKRSLASGIGATGFSVGVIVFPIILTSLQEQYGWRGCMLIFAGLIFNACVCGVIMRPSTIEKQRAKTCRSEKENSGSVHKSVPNRTEGRKISCSPHKYILLQNITFTCLCLTILMSNLSLNIIFVHLPRYVTLHHTSPLQLQMMFLVMGIAGIIGKLSSGFGTGRVRRGKPLDKMCLLFGAFGILGITQVILPSVSNSQPGRLVYAFFTGCYNGIEPTVVVPVTIELVGINDMSSALGAILFCVGLGLIVGPPVAAGIEVLTADYGYSFYFGGLTYLLATILCLTVVYLDKHKHRADVSAQEESAQEENAQGESVQGESAQGEDEIVPHLDISLNICSTCNT